MPVSLDLSLDLNQRTDQRTDKRGPEHRPGGSPGGAGARHSPGERSGRSRPAAPVRPYVTAVLVCHDGAEYLPRSLAAIAAQTRPPDLLIAVDAGSRDQSPELLSAAIDRRPAAAAANLVR